MSSTGLRGPADSTRPAAVAEHGDLDYRDGCSHDGNGDEDDERLQSGGGCLQSRCWQTVARGPKLPTPSSVNKALSAHTAMPLHLYIAFTPQQQSSVVATEPIWPTEPFKKYLLFDSL